MKKLTTILSIILLQSCVVENPKIDDCKVRTIVVKDVLNGNYKDIKISSGTDYFYIYNGLDKGFTVEGLKQTLVGKQVDVYLPKFFIGSSEYIAQLKVDNEILYSEFTE